MKKNIALLLLLTLFICIAAAALAAGGTGTTILTAVVPEPSYTIHVPADMTLEFGNGEIQEIGSFGVSDLVNVKKNLTASIWNHPDLKSGSNTIPVKYYWKYSSQNWNDETVNGFTVYDYSRDETGSYYIAVQVTEADWKAAVPGTYTATLTFYFDYSDH